MINIKMCTLQKMAHSAHREIVHHCKNDKSPSGFLSHNISSHQIKSHSVASAYRCCCTIAQIIWSSPLIPLLWWVCPGKLHFFIKSINDICITIATHKCHLKTYFLLLFRWVFRSWAQATRTSSDSQIFLVVQRVWVWRWQVRFPNPL